MNGLISFIKTIPALVKLVQDFVDAWQKTQIITINVNYQEREEERETIIWAMEEARKAHDIVKIRALNRSLAALDGNKVMREGPVQSSEN